MKLRIPILLSALVVIPLLLLAALGLRLQSSDQLVREHQQYQLANAELRLHAETIGSYIRALEQESLQAFDELQLGSTLSASQLEAIRGFVAQDPMLEQVFIIDSAEKRLFPPTYQASQKEAKFINQTQDLWDTPDVFRSKVPNEVTVAAAAPAPRPARDFSFAQVQKSAASLSDTTEALGDTKPNEMDYGWISWDLGNATKLFFWFRDPQGNVIGQQLSSAFWMSELINRLPPSNNELTNTLITLVNKRQKTLYQWGNAQLSGKEQGSFISQNMLSQPLDGWRLEYYAKNIAIGDFEKKVLYGLIFVIFAALLSVLGVYMLREYRREERLALQRVSFVNQVSHELKTPLTNICMYTEMLESEVTENQQPNQVKVKKYSGVVTSESQRLARLINNVLRFSSSAKQPQRLRPTAVVIDEVIAKTIGNFALAFDAKNIKIEMKLDNTELVMCDEEVLEQVLNNLLSNVEKYASTGKYALIESSFQNNITRICVSDSGPGIEAKLVSTLFEPFVRGSDKLTEGVSGTGIGLNIARELCQLHGGDLRYEKRNGGNTNEISGACFIVTLHTPVVGVNQEAAS